MRTTFPTKATFLIAPTAAYLLPARSTFVTPTKSSHPSLTALRTAMRPNLKLSTSDPIQPRPTLKELKKTKRVRARRVFLLQSLAGTVAALGLALWLASKLPRPPPRARSATSSWAPVHGVRVIRTLPHDPAAFTQGLTFAGGRLFESTGLVGQSSLRELDASSGEILTLRSNGAREFAEGVTGADKEGRELMQVLWKAGRGHIWDAATLSQRASFELEGHAWGIARADDGAIFVSDGSSTVRVFRRKGDALVQTRVFVVTDGGREVALVNELEVVGEELWANVWYSDVIARIDLQSGRVKSWVHCGGLLKTEHVPPGHRPDVLNGIAYDEREGRILVTGKKWPLMFEVEVTETVVAKSVRGLNPFFMDKRKVKEIMARTE